VDANAVADPKFGEVLAKPTVLDLLNHAIHWENCPSVEQMNLSEPMARLNRLFGIGGRRSLDAIEGTPPALCRLRANDEIAVT